MQKQCGLQERQSTSLARTSSRHAEPEVERLSLHCNLEGKFNPGLTRSRIICVKAAYPQPQGWGSPLQEIEMIHVLFRPMTIWQKLLYSLFGICPSIRCENIRYSAKFVDCINGVVCDMIPTDSNC